MRITFTSKPFFKIYMSKTWVHFRFDGALDSHKYSKYIYQLEHSWEVSLKDYEKYKLIYIKLSNFHLRKFNIATNNKPEVTLVADDQSLGPYLVVVETVVMGISFPWKT